MNDYQKMTETWFTHYAQAVERAFREGALEYSDGEQVDILWQSSHARARLHRELMDSACFAREQARKT